MSVTNGTGTTCRVQDGPPITCSFCGEPAAFTHPVYDALCERCARREAIREGGRAEALFPMLNYVVTAIKDAGGSEEEIVAAIRGRCFDGFNPEATENMPAWVTENPHPRAENVLDVNPNYKRLLAGLNGGLA